MNSITELLSNIFGANFRTTIMGLFIAAYQAYKDGAYTDPLDFKLWIMPVLFAVIGYLMKDKLVTGGKVVQDSKGRFSGVNTSVNTGTGGAGTGITGSNKPDQYR